MEVITRAPKERNYAIDLLRILAMYMVCMIHMNLFTSAHVKSSIIPGKEYFFYFGTWTESIGFIGVNLYALITGYVCLNSKWRLSRYLELWCQVAFYTVSLVMVGMLLFYSGVLPSGMCKEYIVKILLKLPVGSEYWYFSAYTALFFIIPFINKLLLSLRQRDYILMLGGLLLMLPCANLLQDSTIYSSGYNFTWLAALYAAGAYIKRFQPKISPWITGPIALVCTLQPLFCQVLDLPIFLSYCSPVMVLYSLCLFLFMYRRPINNGLLRKVIIWAAPLSFGVYLIHGHPWCWSVLECYVPILNEYMDYPWCIAIAGGAILYIFCSFVDWGRSRLFLLIRVRKLTERVGNYIEKSVIKMLNRILSEKEQNT